MNPFGSLRQNNVQFKLQTFIENHHLSHLSRASVWQTAACKRVSVKLLVRCMADQIKFRATNGPASVIVSFVGSNEEEHCKNSPFWCFSLGSVSRPGANKHSGLVAMTV